MTESRHDHYAASYPCKAHNSSQTRRAEPKPSKGSRALMRRPEDIHRTMHMNCSGIIKTTTISLLCRFNGCGWGLFTPSSCSTLLLHDVALNCGYMSAGYGWLTTKINLIEPQSRCKQYRINVLCTVYGIWYSSESYPSRRAASSLGRRSSTGMICLSMTLSKTETIYTHSLFEANTKGVVEIDGPARGSDSFSNRNWTNISMFGGLMCVDLYATNVQSLDHNAKTALTVVSLFR